MIKISPKLYSPIKEILKKPKLPKIRLISKENFDIYSSSSIANGGLQEIIGIQKGQFGTVCKGSKPLEEFIDVVGEDEFEKLTKIGISTNREGWANSFLKSNIQTPLSTSSIQDCSVLYLANEKLQTHLLFHTYYKNNEKDFLAIIKTFMPEGFNKAYIIPGNKYWTDRHTKTLPEMFNAIKKSNPKAVINVSHNSSELPEIVCYNGNVYEIPNRLVMLGLPNQGQATYRISDLKEEHLNFIKNKGDTTQELQDIKEDILTKGYDKEIIKIFNKILDSRIAILKDIEECSTLEELQELISYLKPIEVIENFKSFEIQKSKILSKNKSI